MYLQMLAYETVNLVLFKMWCIDQTTTDQPLRLIGG